MRSSWCVLAVAASLLLLPKHVQSRELPEFYGTYLYREDKKVDLPPQQLTFRVALRLADLSRGMYGLAKLPDLTLAPGPLEIVHFSESIPPTKVRLSEISFLKSAPAHFFVSDSQRPDRAFFRSIYGVSYDKMMPINLWVLERDIPLNIGPMHGGKAGMYRLVPKQALSQGIYAVNFGGIGGATPYMGERSLQPFLLGTPEGLREKTQPSTSR